jgi:SAM-dependent methyltransferase
MARDIDHRLTERELAELDALLVAHESPWWDSFYADRAKPCPFFVTSPDESLTRLVRDEGLIRPGRAIEFGCGNGRNAIFLARHRFSVEAVDYSRSAIDWASERIAEAGVAVALMRQDVFELELEAGAYDLVYDAGCFHHMPPHRRQRYVDLVVAALRPGGWFGVTYNTPRRWLHLSLRALPDDDGAAVRSLLPLPLVPAGDRNVVRVERDDRVGSRAAAARRGRGDRHAVEQRQGPENIALPPMPHRSLEQLRGRRRRGSLRPGRHAR